MSERLTREERRQKQALEDKRKAGELPPEVDNEGNMINPHIPEFMSKAPWYLSQAEGEGLKHQRLKSSSSHPSLPFSSSASASASNLDRWYKRGSEAQVASKKKKGFVKGACKNCGATTHKEKDCLERPRKLGAWKTKSDIAKDDVQQEALELSYEAARDRWNGYDVNEHIKTVKLFNKAEEEKRKVYLRERDKKIQLKKQKKLEREKRREEKRKLKLNKKERGDEQAEEDESESDLSSDDSSDEEDADVIGVKQADSAEQVFKVGNKVKATVRNLRIREDTAKYLRNLDPDSAFYDGKTRSMRANPNPDIDPSEADYAGDNYVRNTGDAVEIAKAQVFAWEAARRGETEGHLLANPTQLLLAKKQFEERAQKLKELRKKEMHERYGGEQHVQSRPDKALLEGVQTQYVEYTPDGRVLKGPDQVVQTKYEEDVLEGNHTSVWGSYFDRETMSWGYGCCFQTSRNAYCTGKAGRDAKIASLNVGKHQASKPDHKVDTNISSSSKEEGKISESRTGKDRKDRKRKKEESKSRKKHKKRKRSSKRDSDSDSDAYSDASSTSSSTSSSASTSDSRRQRSKKRSSKHRSKRKRARSPRGEKKDKKDKKEDSKKDDLQTTQTNREGIEEKELESYRLNKVHADDPMANLLGSTNSDVLLPK